VKSLLSRRGNLLDSAPSFLVRHKAQAPVRFAAAPESRDEAHEHEHEPQVEDSLQKSPQTAPRTSAVRVTSLRAVLPSTAQAGARPLQAAQIAEVEWLLQQGALATFRSFSSFAYSATLLFHSRELIYYAALYHEDGVWRVLKANDIDAAELAFRHFVEQAMRLAEAEMRRAYLTAQNDQFSREVAEAEATLERARVDLQRGSAFDQEVALRQQEIRKELAQLEGRRVASQAQLNKLQRQLNQADATSNESVPHLQPAR
jgi:hypothetical protein